VSDTTPSAGSEAAASTLSRSAPRRRSARDSGNGAVAWLFLPPALLLFTIFVVVPMGEAVWYSVFKWNGFGSPSQFVGLLNFELLFEHPVFRLSLFNNVLVILATLLIQLPLALGLAVLLVDRVPLTTTFRLIFFLPYILAEVATGLIWRFVYDGDYGLFAKLWEMFGAVGPHVLAEPDMAIYAVLAVSVWKYFGFYMILYIAGLQQIDRSLYEAARIDGASRWQVFSRITLPLLGSTVRLTIFFAILSSIQKFDLIMALTGGGPNDSTQTMVSFLYSYGLTRMDIGFGSAVGVVLFVMCVAFAFGYKRTVMRHD
jgi:raffinose/stachyose/melibiose transport system permease protein